MNLHTQFCLYLRTCTYVGLAIHKGGHIFWAYLLIVLHNYTFQPVNPVFASWTPSCIMLFTLPSVSSILSCVYISREILVCMFSPTGSLSSITARNLLQSIIKSDLSASTSSASMTVDAPLSIMLPTLLQW